MMDDKLLLDVAVLAGEIMLSSGAETYRVEDTMDHILKKGNRESVESFALMTGIVATVNDRNMDKPLTVMRTVNRRSTNLSNIMKVNDISRRYCEEKITLDEAWNLLTQVKQKEYCRFFYNLAMSGVAAGFVMMFGGTLWDVLAGTIVGFLLGLIVTATKMGRLNAIITDILSGVGISMATLALGYLASGKLNTDIIIISSMMSIVPGVAITNAIRDTLHGDYLSGSARILEAFVKAASIALGVGIGMALLNMILGGAL